MEVSDARRKVFGYIEGPYIPHRRRSALGYQTPINHESGRPAGA